MEALIYKASDDQFRGRKTINTLNDLLSLREEYGHHIVIEKDFTHHGKLVIVLYDDALES